MPDPEQIRSLKNPRVQQVRALQKRRERERTGLTVVEGVPELSRALESADAPQGGVQFQTLVLCESLVSEAGRGILEKLCEASETVLHVTSEIFTKLAYRETSGGMVATVIPPRYELATLRLGETPFVLVLEAIEKPGNLGATLRSADGAGVDAVVVCDGITDPFNPNAIRSSLGTVFSVPIVTATDEATNAWLEEQGLVRIATSPGATKCYTDADWTGPRAVLIGSEHKGLSGFWLERADETVHIPMGGRADSLNAATAAAVMLFEAARQRRDRTD